MTTDNSIQIYSDEWFNQFYDKDLDWLLEQCIDKKDSIYEELKYQIVHYLAIYYKEVIYDDTLFRSFVKSRLNEKFFQLFDFLTEERRLKIWDGTKKILFKYFIDDTERTISLLNNWGCKSIFEFHNRIEKQIIEKYYSLLLNGVFAVEWFRNNKIFCFGPHNEMFYDVLLNMLEMKYYDGSHFNIEDDEERLNLWLSSAIKYGTFNLDKISNKEKKELFPIVFKKHKIQRRILKLNLKQSIPLPKYVDFCKLTIREMSEELSKKKPNPDGFITHESLTLDTRNCNLFPLKKIQAFFDTEHFKKLKQSEIIVLKESIGYSAFKIESPINFKEGKTLDLLLLYLATLENNGVIHNDFKAKLADMEIIKMLSKDRPMSKGAIRTRYFELLEDREDLNNIIKNFFKLKKFKSVKYL